MSDRLPALDTDASTASTPSAAWSDELIVQACLRGDERAWSVLIQRYKNLIYSFPRRYGVSPQDAGDVFQLVCGELFLALPNLRNQQSVRSWIITVASHQTYQWKRRHITRSMHEGEYLELTSAAATTEPSSALEKCELQQEVRGAIARLAPRDQALIKLLFYEDAPTPYQAVASRLGLARGSIGLTRSRCLRKLEQVLMRVSMRGGVSPGNSQEQEK